MIWHLNQSLLLQSYHFKNIYFFPMKKLQFVLAFLFLVTSFLSFAQGKPQISKIKITGKVIEKGSKQTLEYATITFMNPKSPKAVAGGITNPKGEFDIDIIPGTYDIKIEFISFKPIIIKDRNF